MKEEAKMMRGSFMAEMKKIKGRHFDLAFLVLDPRQSDELACEGLEIFNAWTRYFGHFPNAFLIRSCTHGKAVVKSKKQREYCQYRKGERI